MYNKVLYMVKSRIKEMRKDKNALLPSTQAQTPTHPPILIIHIQTQRPAYVTTGVVIEKCCRPQRREVRKHYHREPSVLGSNHSPRLPTPRWSRSRYR